MKNTDIRTIAKGSDIKLWRIADRLGISDVSFSKMLRKELSEDKKTKIVSVINDLKCESVLERI